MVVGATHRTRPVGLLLPGLIADISAKKCFATSNPFSWSGWFSWLGMGVPCWNVREEDVGATVGRAAGGQSPDASAQRIDGVSGRSGPSGRADAAVASGWARPRRPLDNMSVILTLMEAAAMIHHPTAG